MKTSKSYSEFLKIVRSYLEVDKAVKNQATWSGDRGRDNLSLDNIAGHGYDDLKYNVKTETLSLRWQTGGASGGSCWGDEAEAFTSSEPAPEFKAFESVVELFVPEISLMKFRMLVGASITETSDHESEYYGNYRDYAVKEASMKKLYEAMIELGLL